MWWRNEKKTKKKEEEDQPQRKFDWLVGRHTDARTEGGDRSCRRRHN